jgi:hypothetical protein
MRYFLMITLLMLTACAPLVPATTPPQLVDTPGAFVTITDEFYDAGIFRVHYPQSWRTVKISIAAEPMRVVFVSPDDSMLITLSEVPLPEPEIPPDTVIVNETVPSENVTIYAQGQAPAILEADFRPIFERVLASLIVPV